MSSTCFCCLGSMSLITQKSFEFSEIFPIRKTSTCTSNSIPFLYTMENTENSIFFFFECVTSNICTVNQPGIQTEISLQFKQHSSSVWIYSSKNNRRHQHDVNNFCAAYSFDLPLIIMNRVTYVRRKYRSNVSKCCALRVHWVWAENVILYKSCSHFIHLVFVL